MAGLPTDAVVPRPTRQPEFTLVVRNFDLIAGPDIAQIEAPRLPAAFSTRAHADRWVECFGTISGVEVRFMSRAMAVQGARACFFCAGPIGIIARIEALPSMGSWTNFAALRADGGAVATAVKTNWRDERPIIGGVRTGTLIALYARLTGWDGDDGE